MPDPDLEMRGGGGGLGSQSYTPLYQEGQSSQIYFGPFGPQLVENPSLEGMHH